MSNDPDSLHLLERINIDLQVQQSIVPAALSLARFKVAGKLPTLQVNLSDAKYKSLMRLVDVCIPKFGDAPDSTDASPAGADPLGFPLPMRGLFSQADQEYHVEEDEAHDRDDHESSKEEQFFEADDGLPEVSERHPCGPHI
jgi:vacuolar protein sorting-associated protein 13A/C